jgi:hypothetical protein
MPFTRGRPDLGTKEARRLGNQSMAKVRKHHLVAEACREGVIEGDGANLPGEWMGKTDRGSRPRASERRNNEGAGLGPGQQWSLPTELKTNADDTFNRFWGDVEIGDALVELGAQGRNLVAEPALGFADLLLCPPFGDGEWSVINGASAAKERLFYLIGEDRAGAADVVADGVDLLGYSEEELEVGLHRARRGVLPAGADEVMNEYLWAWLAMAVDAPCALLEA